VLNEGDPAMHFTVAQAAGLAVALVQVTVTAEAGMVPHAAPPVKPAAATFSCPVDPAGADV
jgi:hypothetical protein